MQTQKTFSKTFKVDIPVLKFLISNFETFKIEREIDPNLKKKLIDIRNKCSNDGTITEYYSRTRAYGRFKASNGCNNIMREFRNEIFRKDYVDIDFVNTQPTILHQYTTKNNIPQTYISMYVNNRNEWFEELIKFYNKPKGWVKEKINEITNGSGEYKRLVHDRKIKPHPKLDGYQQDIKNCMDAILNIEKDEKLYHQKKPLKDGRNLNLACSVIATVCQNIEANCLMAMEEFIKQEFKTDIKVHMFDGGYVLKEFKEKIEVKIPEMEKYIFSKTNYNLKIIFKEMATEIIIPDEAGKTKNKNVDGTYDEIKLKFETEEKVCKIMNPVSFAKISDRGEIFTFTKKALIDKYENYSSYRGKEFSLTKSTFINNWILDPNITTYDRIDFYPPPLQCPDDVLNTFTGFAQERRNADFEKKNGRPMGTSQKALKMIRDITRRITGSEENNNYFEHWLANIVQEPGNLSRTFILIRTALQGIGKNEIYKFFCRIIGEHYTYFSGKSTEGIFDGFNAIIKGKLLINIDEATTELMNSKIDNIKEMVGSTVSKCTKKGVDTEQIQSFIRLLIYANNNVEHKVEPQARRDVAFESYEAPMSAKEQQEYQIVFNSPIAMNTYYKYLQKIDLKNYNFSKKRPITDYLKRCMARYRPNVYEFLQSVFEGSCDKVKLEDYVAYDTHKNIKKINNNVVYKIKSNDFYKAYIDHCYKNSCKNGIISKADFDSLLKTTKGVLEGRSCGYDCYSFSVEPVKLYMKEMKYWIDACITNDDEDQNSSNDEQNKEDVFDYNFKIEEDKEDEEEEEEEEKFKQSS